MQRYEIHEIENGMWAVVDHDTGKPLVDRNGLSERTRLEAQALADFRNGRWHPPRERVTSPLHWIRAAWMLLSELSRGGGRSGG